jgi:activating signal cointegrator 1
MKCLTVKQPFASLIVNGYKEYEFRTWKTNYRGKIGIHAGMSTDKRINKFKDYNLEYVNGAIIGEAEIVDCILVDDKLKKELLNKNYLVYENSFGYAFVLKNIIKYDKPIYTKGKLSFWNYDK